MSTSHEISFIVLGLRLSTGSVRFERYNREVCSKLSHGSDFHYCLETARKSRPNI
jgi:hypothetical protein